MKKYKVNTEFVIFTSEMFFDSYQFHEYVIGEIFIFFLSILLIFLPVEIRVFLNIILASNIRIVI